jgi:hypothetical protein
MNAGAEDFEVDIRPRADGSGAWVGVAKFPDGLSIAVTGASDDACAEALVLRIGEHLRERCAR